MQKTRKKAAYAIVISVQGLKNVYIWSSYLRVLLAFKKSFKQCNLRELHDRFLLSFCNLYQEKPFHSFKE